MFVKILSKQWISKFAVNTGGSKSFGPISIDDFFEAMVQCKKNNPKTDLAHWIESTKFMEDLPTEMVVGHTKDSFVRCLNAYNPDTMPFLDKNENFYLWMEGGK